MQHASAEEEEGHQVNMTSQEQNDLLYRKDFVEFVLKCCAGKELREFPSLEGRILGRESVPPFPEPVIRVYPFSDQKAMFIYSITNFWSYLPFGRRWKLLRSMCSGTVASRFRSARERYRDGSTWNQRIFAACIALSGELFIPLVWLLCFFPGCLLGLFLDTGLRLPLLSFFYWAILKSGLNGLEGTIPGENGYSKVFCGGDDVDLEELEKELTTRNENCNPDPEDSDVNTISISYKHFANKDKDLGDNRKICRADLAAIAALIKASSPCKLRFWIDGKLPLSTDDTFERWINRGVRPYARYITFLCPSAQEYTDRSFWLANEYHFASATKGVLFFKDDQIFYEYRFRYKVDLYSRFLQILIRGQSNELGVRNEDLGKAVHWAMCCLCAKERGFGFGSSLIIDNLTVTGELYNIHNLLENTQNVVRALGEQELPVIPGKSWNKENPLLLSTISCQAVDFSCWLGLSQDNFSETVYFIHTSSLGDVLYETMVVLQVNLDKPHFCKENITVVRKVLREVNSCFLSTCKFVTLPWLCNWK